MRRPGIVLGVLVLLLIAAVALRLSLGPEGLSWPARGAWALRIDRVLSGVIVGSALALGGAFLQTLLRNPLASPDLIGPAAGAGFAVMLSTYLTHATGVALSLHGATTVNSGAALAGALGALSLVYALSQRRGAVEPVQLVLVGVVISIMFGAGTMFLVYLMPDRGLSMMSRWTIGALSDDAPRAALASGGILVLLAMGAGWMHGPTLDAASLTDDEATSVGVPIRTLRLGLFLGAGALTAAAVVLAGPVGFVGLISPHLVRGAAGPSHRVVIVGSALCGAAIVVASDAMTRLVDFGSGRMPLGILTAVAGGVAFIWLVGRRQVTQLHNYQT